MTDWDRPRPLFVIFFILAAIIGYLSWILPRDNSGWAFIKFVLAVIAIGVGAYALINLLDYAVWFWQTANKARYSIVLAETLRGMNPQVADAWKDHTAIQVIGMIGPDLKTVWRIRAHPVDVDWNFARDLVIASRATFPRMAAVSHAYQDIGGVNAERMASSLTGLFVDLGIAEPGAGNLPARFIVTWEQLAECFDVKG